MTAFYIVIGIVLLVVAVFFAGEYYIYRKAFFTARRREDIRHIPKSAQYQELRDKMLALIDEMDALPFEEVTITSFDGLELFGRYYHIDDDAPLQIQFHGYRGTAIRDFCGGNKLARKLGFNTLVVDQRAHGKSEGKTITFGILERFDCMSWVDYASKRFDCPIYLAGVSMGAATILMASELGLPSNVKGIIADCPYSSPKDIIYKVCVSDMKLPRITYPLVKISAKLFGKFDLEAASALNAVKGSHTPILLIHGEDDHFVPCEMSRKIASMNPHIRLVTFPSAGHGISYVVDPIKYEQAVTDFVRETSST